MNARHRLLLLLFVWFGLVFFSCYVANYLHNINSLKIVVFKIQITITFIAKIACKIVNIIFDW